jgi:hypothetical protein
MRPRFWIPCVVVVLAVSSIVFLTSRSSDAGQSSLGKKAKSYLAIVKSEQALNLRLMALESLRKSQDSGVDAELVKLAKGKDIPLAVYATRALGKRKTAATKKALKALLEDSKVDRRVRIGAMSAIAYHWRSLSDLSYLESKVKNDTKLASQCAWLKSKIYKR